MPEASRLNEPVYASARRRHVEVALGVLWLLDGVLQFQPYMFTRAFMQGILGMANMGLPGPLSRADFDVARLLTTGYPLWNAVFATLQVAIGAGLIWGRGRTLRSARAMSVVWALAVWTIGEGVGGMFMGGTSVLTGAPGAALLYAVLALVIWPPRIRLGPGRLAWAVLWAGMALLELQATNHGAGVPGAQIANGGFGEPGAVAAFDRVVGHVLAGRGAVFAAALGTTAVFVGLGALWTRTRRFALAAGVAVAAFVGVAGQDLGGVLTGQGTDPGSGPLLILLAVALWPVSGAGGAGVPAREESEVEAELLGCRDDDPDPRSRVDSRPGGRGDHASPSQRQLPVGAVADPDQDGTGPRRRYHYPAARLADQAGRGGHDAGAAGDLVEPPVR